MKTAKMNPSKIRAISFPKFCLDNGRCDLFGVLSKLPGDALENFGVCAGALGAKRPIDPAPHPA
ncbi:hypothetical protein RV134_390214 [Roseovarius sp. EC-HK134]|nr:hypothetical protein RV420_470033 [Roseovarius sp. EC-SD190]VVT33716.1 hypothetical protein RV134_390214 [Roseovarius sp. EC-HK134]